MRYQRKKMIPVETIAGILVLGLTAGVMEVAVSSSDDDHLEARRLTESQMIMPLETIIEQIQASHPGRILEVEMESEHGRYVYEIELLDPSGRVWELEIDAVSGEVLEQELED